MIHLLVAGQQLETASKQTSDSGHKPRQGWIYSTWDWPLLGFWHQHQRPDRDQIVEVLYDNIPPPYHHLFYKILEDELNSLHVGHDYGSIMHLSLFAAYSIDSNAPSLRLLKDYGGEVGQRRNTSESDREQVRLLFYVCPGESTSNTKHFRLQVWTIMNRMCYIRMEFHANG